MKRIIGGFALALAFAPGLFAQMSGEQKPTMMSDCAAMKQQQDGMQKHMAEMTATLQTAVEEMNKAKGSVKVDKMAAVINELVTQRAMMQKHMMEMQPKMMKHMMQHMHHGVMKGMSESMSGCPMMKGSDKSPSAPAPEHKH